MKAEAKRIKAFIREKLAEAGFSRVVVGLSGGIDSALTCALCAEALGAENVQAMILPYKTSNPDSATHACLEAERLGVVCEQFEITDMVDSLVRAYPEMSSGRKGNIMARCRMTVLFDQSAAFNGLVMGTSNRTELLLGYFTMHGDGAAAMEPLGHLYKCQVKDISRHLNVTRAILDKQPSADLWKGQTDEAELGFSYDEADQVLYWATEVGLNKQEIALKGLSPTTVDAVLQRMNAMAFKLRPIPMPDTRGRCSK